MAETGTVKVLSLLLCLVVVIMAAWAHPLGEPNLERSGRNETSDLFGYPAEQSTVEAKQNARNRTPIYVPNRCAVDEILYPGDQETDWVCDCKPTFVYHAAEKKCYEMYTRGFCEENHIIHLKPGGTVPTCISNPCGDGRVPFRTSCVVLHQQYSECNVAGIRRVIGINEVTHELDCINISAVSEKMMPANNITNLFNKVQL